MKAVARASSVTVTISAAGGGSEAPVTPGPVAMAGTMVTEIQTRRAKTELFMQKHHSQQNGHTTLYDLPPL